MKIKKLKQEMKEASEIVKKKEQQQNEKMDYMQKQLEETMKLGVM